MALPIVTVRTLPRKNKRMVWKKWWKHLRHEFQDARGKDTPRRVMRQRWRDTWKLLAW